MRVSSTDRTAAVAPVAVPGPAESTSPSNGGIEPAFGNLLRSVGNEFNHGEAATLAALHSLRGGGDFTSSQLLLLQADVYRYSEAIDLASRAVDRVTGGVKTLLQGGGS